MPGRPGEARLSHSTGRWSSFTKRRKTKAGPRPRRGDRFHQRDERSRSKSWRRSEKSYRRSDETDF
jgi:hypothetical protein